MIFEAFWNQLKDRTDYDFYSVLSNDDVRLQDTLKSEDSESEIQNFFQEEVINNLKK